MYPLTVYRASAGSGKTFTLAVEYIKLLVLAQGGGEHAHILGVTFTNKATAEMKDRILTHLYGLAHELPASNDYLNALRDALSKEADAPATDDELRRRCGVALHEILHDYSRFRVQTIDAFFQTVLRGLAHELGLSANLQVEISDTEVLSQAVDRIVEHLQDEPRVLDWMLSLVRERIENNQRWDVTWQVKRFGSTIFNEQYQLRGDALRALLSDEEALRRLDTDIRSRETAAVDTLHRYAEEIKSAVAASQCSVSDFSNGTKILAPYLLRLASADATNLEPNNTLISWAANSELMVKKGDRNRSDLIAAASAVSAILAKLFTELPQLQHDINSARLALGHIKPLLLLDRIDREVATINTETSRFNLAKTPILLRQMIGESDVPFIFEKIGTQLHHIMIDEFQDTSTLQWQNFRPLLAECRSRGGRNLIVGDVKQSIYRFRGGDWRTLANIKKDVVPTPTLVPKDTNFRSERHIVDFTTQFFLSAVTLLDEVSADDEMAVGGDFSFTNAYDGVKQKASPKRMTRDAEGYVRAVVFPASPDVKTLILDDLRCQVAELHARGLAYNQMTILVRNNYESADVIDAFAADPAMPRIVSDEAFLLNASPAVRLLVESLRTLSNLRPDPIARLYVATNLGPEAAEMLEQNRESLRLLPLTALVEHLLRVFGINHIAGQQAYLLSFLDAVADFARTTSTDLQAFITYWDEKLFKQSIPASSIDGIRIITIHKSKGLEFQTVFIPFCTWTMDTDRRGSILWTTPDEAPYSAFSLLPITPTSKTAPKSAFARDYSQEHLSARLDEFNAMYVAFTRPRANLFIWSSGGDLERSTRTVGDLVACTLPLCSDMDVTFDGDVTDKNNPATAIYTLGTPCLRLKSDDEATRVSPVATPVSLSLESFDAKLPFKQSNRSAAFFEQMDPEADASLHIAATTPLALGRLLHTLLQNIATTDDIPRVLDAFTHEGVISQTSADGTYVSLCRADIESRLRRAMDNELVASWFRPWWTLHTECAIVCRDKDGHAKTLRPDRVMSSPDGSHIIVVDFKTAHYNEEYDRQVQTYMELISAMHPEATVEGYLWFVLTGKVKKVEN